MLTTIEGVWRRAMCYRTKRQILDVISSNAKLRWRREPNGFGLAVLYVVTGKLGLMLALPPGYASGIFPAAGVGVACAYLYGKRAILWIFLGSLGLNFWVGWHSLNTAVVCAAIAIASFSALQSACGGYVLRRALGLKTELLSGTPISRYLLLSPIICLVSATLSLLSLIALGVIDTAQWFISWGTWWVGDTMGVIIVFPLVVALACYHDSAWQRRGLIVIGSAAVAMALVVVAYLQTNRMEVHELSEHIRLQTDRFAEQLQDRLGEQEYLLSQLEAHIKSKKIAEVTSEDFSAYAQPMLERFPMIQAIEWIPAVEHSDLTAFEASQQRRFPDFRVYERDAHGKPVPAAYRPTYYPVTFASPMAGNEKAMGYDLGSETHRNQAIQRAIWSSHAVGSHPVELVQFKSDHKNSAILLFKSVNSSRNDFGLVLTVIQVEKFVSALLSTHTDLDIRLRDIAANETVFGHHYNQKPLAGFTHTLRLGGRQYLLEAGPSSSFMQAHRSYRSWAVLVVGSIGSGLFCCIMLLVTGTTTRIRHLVVERTRELDIENEKNRILLERASDGVHILDESGNVFAFSQSFAQMLGYSADEVKRLHVADWDAHYSRDQLAILMQRFIAKPTVFETKHRRKNGTVIDVEVSTKGIVIGEKQYLYASARDITYRKLVEENARKAAEEIEDLYNHAPCGYHSLDKTGVVTRMNDTELQWLGYSRDQVVGRMHYKDFVAAAYWPVIEEKLNALVTYGTGYETDIDVVCKDGSTRHMHVNASAVTDASGNFMNCRATMFDITELKQAQEEIQYFAYHDALTDLPNRRLMLEKLQLAVAQARRFGRSMALMSLDLDQFKQINDTLGHDIGDELLKSVAKRLLRNIRSGDTLSRLGGDEFMLVLTEISRPSDVRIIAEKIIAALTPPITVKENELYVTVSIGIAEFTVDGTDDAQSLMKKADIAMYAAKKNGRNRYDYFRPEDTPPPSV